MTATPTTLKLPPELADLDLKLSKALNTVVLKIWPEDKTFVPADSPHAIAKVLIHSSHLHARLSSARIAYVFKESLTKGGEPKAGIASKASAKLEYFAGLDFIIEFSHDVWAKIMPEQRIALVDHELSHCDRDPETGAWQMRRHDIEEFSDVVSRWGAWTIDLRGFTKAIRESQIDLFDGQPELPGVPPRLSVDLEEEDDDDVD